MSIVFCVKYHCTIISTHSSSLKLWIWKLVVGPTETSYDINKINLPRLFYWSCILFYIYLIIFGLYFPSAKCHVRASSCFVKSRVTQFIPLQLSAFHINYKPSWHIHKWHILYKYVCASLASDIESSYNYIMLKKLIWICPES